MRFPAYSNPEIVLELCARLVDADPLVDALDALADQGITARVVARVIDLPKAVPLPLLPAFAALVVAEKASPVAIRANGTKGWATLLWRSPDLAVVQPLTRRQQPSTALLVVEVAQTSQVHDHSKAGVYAAADVAEDWIADLAARKLVVHRSPIAGVYEDVVTYADGESVTGLFVDAPSVAVTELLG